MAPPPSSAHSVTGKAVKGALVLGIRQVTVQLIGAIGGILLARLLTPAEFGVYAVFTFLFTLLTAVGDLGLGASLIRQVEEPISGDLQRVFAIRQGLALTSFALVWFAAPFLSQAYLSSEAAVWPLRLVAFAALLTSFQLVPTVILDRRLSFHRLAIVDIAQVLVYTCTAVGLVWQGAGVWSFGLAWLGYGLTGAGLASLACPWQIGWRFSWSWTQTRLGFSLPFQGISLINLGRDSINPILVGLLLGTAQVGYVNWALMVSTVTILALFVLQRVYMPALAQVQDQTEELQVLFKHLLFATHAVAAPAAMVLLVFINPITHIVFGEKWLAALPLFYPLWLANLLAPSVVVMLSLLNALGHSNWSFRFSLLSMGMTWICGMPLILAFGSLGFAAANVVAQLSNLYLLAKCRSLIAVRILPHIWQPWSLALGMGIVAALLSALFPVQTLLELLVAASLCFLVYFCALIALYRAEAQSAVSLFIPAASRAGRCMAVED